jgi:hypothetical protein
VVPPTLEGPPHPASHPGEWLAAAALAFGVLAGGAAPSVAAPAEEIQGETLHLGGGVTETVAQIMERDARLPKGALVIRERPEPENEMVKRPRPDAPAVSHWPLAEGETGSEFPVRPASPDLPQTVGTNFLAIQLSEAGFIPPDSMGAVGPTQVLAISNGRIKVFSKTGTLGSLNTTTDNFFASVGGLTNGTSDPHIRYDRLTQRWFVVMIDVAACPNNVLLAVSSGPTITNVASFTFFSFVGEPGASPHFTDYPTLGVDRNALYIGGNMFDQAAIGCTAPFDPQQTTVWVVNKAALIGGTLTLTAFRNLVNYGTGAGVFTAQGVDNDDPASTEGYFIGVDFFVFSKLVMKRVSNPGGVPTLSADINIVPPTTVFPIAQPQPTIAATLDALDDRLFAAALHKDKVTGLNTLWTAHNIQVDTACVASNTGGRNGSRWYELQNLATTPALRQSGTVCDNAGATPFGFWIPSVGVSGQGHMAIGTSRASTSAPNGGFASITAAGRLRTDALGTVQAPTLVQGSTFTYDVGTPNPRRWGDFSQTVVDPNDDQTLWTFQEYANATNSWGLRVTQLVAPPPVVPATANPASVGQGQASVNVVITGVSAGGSEFFDPGPDTGGPGFANRLASAVSGGVTVNSVTFNSPTQYTLNISTVGTPAGAKDVTVTNPDGQSRTGVGILTVTGCPTITVNPATIPAGTAGTAYSQTFTQTGGTGTITWSVTGTLPAGITLNTGTGVLSGTPTQTGSFPITITATDANNCTGSRGYTLVINCQTITVNPTTIPSGTAGTAYTQTFTQTAGIGTITWSVTGTLPTGITLNPSTGVLSGTPTQTGSFPITITATDSNNCTGSRGYTLIIGCQTITVSPATLPGGTVGLPYSQTLTQTGGIGTINWSVTAGALPPGLTLNGATGLLSGTPTQMGTFNFTITATDGNNCTGSHAYSVQIVVPVELQSLTVE